MKIEYCRFFRTHKVKIILLRNKKSLLQFGYFLLETANVLFFKRESGCLKRQRAPFWDALCLFTVVLITSFVYHDVENHAVGFVHGLGSDSGEVSDGLVYVFVDDSFD